MSVGRIVLIVSVANQTIQSENRDSRWSHRSAGDGRGWGMSLRGGGVNISVHVPGGHPLM